MMARCECGRPGVYTVVLAKNGVVEDQVTFCEVCGVSRPVLKALGELDLTMGIAPDVSPDAADDPMGDFMGRNE